MAGSTKCWKYQLRDFNKHYKVLSIDLLGHGNSSERKSEKYSGPIMANYIRILMDKLEIEKAHILGLSLGSIVEQYFSQMFPERIISLIFASPVTKPNYVSMISNFLSEKVFLKIFSKNTYLKIMGKLMLPGKAHVKSREFFIRETLKMANPEFYKWFRFALNADHYYYLTESNIPTLIVAGEKDFCYFEDAIALKDKYPNNQFKVIKDAGHVFIFQKAEEFNQMVIEYIDSMKVAESKETTIAA
jgi:pimeloyl-ACP methyl ester carboxylesterase